MAFLGYLTRLHLSLCTRSPKKSGPPNHPTPPHPTPPHPTPPHPTPPHPTPPHPTPPPRKEPARGPGRRRVAALLLESQAQSLGEARALQRQQHLRCGGQRCACSVFSVFVFLVFLSCSCFGLLAVCFLLLIFGRFCIFLPCCFLVLVGGGEGGEGGDLGGLEPPGSSSHLGITRGVYLWVYRLFSANSGHVSLCSTDFMSTSDLSNGSN